MRRGIREGGWIAPAVPPTLVVSLLVVGTALTALAAALPARRATQAAPIRALTEA